MSAAGIADRWVGRAGTIAFVVAALALARVIGDQFPDPIQEFQRPHPVQAQVGETAELRLADIEVHGIRVGDQLVGPGMLYPTDGVWVVADLTFTPTLEDAGLPYAQIVDAEGRTYTNTRGYSTSTCGASAPGIPVTCSLALEIPANAADGAALELSPRLDPRYDNVLVLDLGLDAARVAAAEGTRLSLDPTADGSGDDAGTDGSGDDTGADGSGDDAGANSSGDDTGGGR